MRKIVEFRLQMFPISMFNILSLAARPKFKGYFISNYKGTHATFECNNLKHEGKILTNLS